MNDYARCANEPFCGSIEIFTLERTTWNIVNQENLGIPKSSSTGILGVMPILLDAVTSSVLGCIYSHLLRHYCLGTLSVYTQV